jgi:hypothetical protein
MEETKITTEPVVLHTNLAGIATRPCARCTNRTNLIRGQFDPVYCAAHRMNGDLEIGWGYIYREEARMLSLLRAHGWTLLAVNDATENDLSTRLGAATIQPAPQATIRPTPRAKTRTTPRARTRAASRAALEQKVESSDSSDSDDSDYSAPPSTPPALLAIMAASYDDL